jgi:hypothetical protein
MLDTCVILNGPPDSGKDTLANILEQSHGFHKHQMKDQLYIDTALLFSVDVHEFIQRASTRDLKETPWGDLVLAGRAISPREALIHTSETIVKANHGQDYYGHKAAEACQRANSVNAVFSDGGFPDEIRPLIPLYANVVIFRLIREGRGWGNDSRNYLHGFPNTHDLELVYGRPEVAIDSILDAIRSTDNG